MYPPDQHRRPSRTGRRSHGRSNVGHNDQSVLFQYAGADDLALGDDVVDLSVFQPHGSRSFQQPATQSTGGELYTDPAILEGNRSHEWLQQQHNTAQGQLWGHRNLAPATEHDASNYQSGAPSGWRTRQEYSHEQYGASVSMMSSQSPHQRAPSVVFNGSMDSSMQSPEYHHQADAIADGQMFQDASDIDHEHFHHSHMVDPGQLNMELLHVNPEQPPWSAYQTADMHYPSHIPEEPAATKWQHTSETTFSTTDREGSGSGYMGESCTPLSSRDYVSGSMLDSTLTERPDMRYPQSMNSEHIPPDCPPSWHISQMDTDDGNYMATMEIPSTMEGSSQDRASLVVPLQRTHSTRSSASDASSTGPPTFTPEVMYCDVGDCRQAFTGQYRRGNLGKLWPYEMRVRHRLTLHSRETQEAKA